MLTPIVHCRCCHCQVEATYQESWRTNTPGSHLLTCRNPHCAIYGQTFDERDYATVDLNRYVISRSLAGAGQVAK